MFRKKVPRKNKDKRTKMKIEEFIEKEVPNLSDIISFCSNQTISVYADSTVVKSPEVVFRGLDFAHNRFISEEYLLNFRHSEYDMGMITGVNNYRLPMVVGALARRIAFPDKQKLISLPKSKNIRAPLGPVIRSRRSVRIYSGKQITVRDLSTILYYAQGVSGKLRLQNMPETATLGKNDEIDLRTAPSAGGLYPIDLYVISLRILKLARGLYLYVPPLHALHPVKELPENYNLLELAQFGEIQVDRACFLLVYVYKLLENSRKYGDSGLAYALIEAGEVSENIHLVCTALGMGSCDVGGYVKHKLENILQLDGLSQHVIHLTVIGN